MTSRTIALLVFCAALLALMNAPGAAQITHRVEIVLPRRLLAGRPATLATLGANGKLAAHVTVNLGNGDRLQTDATGRVNFIAPPAGVLIAKSAGTSTAVLVDAQPAADASGKIEVAPFTALHSSFDICGGGFQGNAETNHAYVNDEHILTLAASPECIVVAPAPNTAVGPAEVMVEDSSGPRRVRITFVSLNFEPPRPPLASTQKGSLTVRARGTDQRVRILVENETPDVLQFEKGDAEIVLTTGGVDNSAQIRVQAIRSGDFGFHARLLPSPDPVAARRFLEAAEPLAIAPRTLKKLENDLAHHPNDVDRIRVDLDRMLTVTSPSDFRTLLEAARSAL